MKRTNFLLTVTVIFSLLLFNACECSCNLNGDADNAKDTTGKAVQTEKIRNGIRFEETGGLKVTQAFLRLGNDHLVPDDNLVNVGDKIKLTLLIAGWKDDNGRVSIGASEAMKSSDGDTLLVTDDLFKQEPDVTLEDAGIISMSVTVDKVRKLFDYLEVTFKVWNKKADQQVTGSYRFNFK